MITISRALLFTLIAGQALTINAMNNQNLTQWIILEIDQSKITESEDGWADTYLGRKNLCQKNKFEDVFVGSTTFTISTNNEEINIATLTPYNKFQTFVALGYTKQDKIPIIWLDFNSMNKGPAAINNTHISKDTTGKPINNNIVEQLKNINKVSFMLSVKKSENENSTPYTIENTQINIVQRDGSISFAGLESYTANNEYVKFFNQAIPEIIKKYNNLVTNLPNKDWHDDAQLRLQKTDLETLQDIFKPIQSYKQKKSAQSRLEFLANEINNQNLTQLIIPQINQLKITYANTAEMYLEQQTCTTTNDETGKSIQHTILDIDQSEIVNHSNANTLAYLSNQQDQVLPIEKKITASINECKLFSEEEAEKLNKTAVEPIKDSLILPADAMNNQNLTQWIMLEIDQSQIADPRSAYDMSYMSETCPCHAETYLFCSDRCQNDFTKIFVGSTTFTTTTNNETINIATMNSNNKFQTYVALDDTKKNPIIWLDFNDYNGAMNHQPTAINNTHINGDTAGNHTAHSVIEQLQHINTFNFIISVKKSKNEKPMGFPIKNTQINIIKRDGIVSFTGNEIYRYEGQYVKLHKEVIHQIIKQYNENHVKNLPHEGWRDEQLKLQAEEEVLNAIFESILPGLRWPANIILYCVTCAITTYIIHKKIHQF